MPIVETLERRHLLCEEELRLNLRLAPALYLGVSGIGGEAGTPRIGGGGPPLEYAVRMRQFSPTDELSALLVARSVTTDDLAVLGTGIARFHGAAAPAPTGSAYGRPETVHRVTMDNFGELRALPESTDWTAQLSVLESRITALHRELRPLMTERRATGWVRECHGGLHCGNVVRWAGELTPFDGIEFDPALRFIDVTTTLHSSRWTSPSAAAATCAVRCSRRGRRRWATGPG